MKTNIILLLLVLSSSIYAQQEKYYMSKVLDLSFEESTLKVKEAVKKQGFGIVSEEDMDKTLRKKLGDVDIKPIRVLGACNAKLAYRVLKSEDNMAIYLPCKVLIKFVDDAKTEVVFVNPNVAMTAVKNKDAGEVMKEASQMLKKAFESL